MRGAVEGDIRTATGSGRRDASTSPAAATRGRRHDALPDVQHTERPGHAFLCLLRKVDGG
jgi:hypothetical protein